MHSLTVTKFYSVPPTKMKVLESIWSHDRIKPLSFSIVPSLEDVYKRHDYCQYEAVWVMDVTDIHMKSRMNTWYRCVFKGHSLWDVQAIPLEEDLINTYCEADVRICASYYDSLSKVDVYPCPAIKEVIFSPPATIVYWEDETRTVVKCQEGDVFNEEAGLAFCILKKLLGNKSNWNNHIRKLTDGAKRYNYHEESVPTFYVPTFAEAIEVASNTIKKLSNLLNDIYGTEDHKSDDLLSPEELVENNKDFDPENNVVVDLDLKDGGFDELFKKHVEEIYKLPVDTYVELNKNGDGMHLHYYSPEGELIKKIATKDDDALSINIPATCRQCKHHTHLYGTQKTICAKSDDNLDVTQCTRGRSKKCPIW